MTIWDVQGRPLSQFISTIDTTSSGPFSGWATVGLLGGNITGQAPSTGLLPVWFDIRDSEDELQEFLHKCAKYGDAYKSIESKSLSELEQTDG